MIDNRKRKSCYIKIIVYIIHVLIINETNTKSFRGYRGLEVIRVVRTGRWWWWWWSKVRRAMMPRNTDGNLVVRTVVHNMLMSVRSSTSSMASIEIPGDDSSRS